MPPERSAAVRCAVADDEPRARATLRGLLEARDDVELVGEAGDGLAALAICERERPELLFLDVEMPGATGLEVLERLPAESRPLTILTTAHAHFAVPAFDLEAVDFLLKPFDDARFTRALERALERLRPSSEGAEPTRTLDRLAIHREGRVELVEAATIRYVLAASQYVTIHTDTGEHLMRTSLGALERDLDPARFARIHRSALVALDAIRALRTDAAGRATVEVEGPGGERRDLPVAKPRVPELRRRLG